MRTHNANQFVQHLGGSGAVYDGRVACAGAGGGGSNCSLVTSRRPRPCVALSASPAIRPRLSNGRLGSDRKRAVVGFVLLRRGGRVKFSLSTWVGLFRRRRRPWTYS